jgi:hypothetical protein
MGKKKAHRSEPSEETACVGIWQVRFSSVRANTARRREAAGTFDLRCEGADVTTPHRWQRLGRLPVAQRHAT